MDDPTSRRIFLRTAAGAAVWGLAGCVPDRPERTGWAGGRGDGARGGPGAGGAPDVVQARPLVRSLGEDAVRIVSPLDARPAAYVSMASRQVFVDRAYRDRASWLLDAHISVSTWVWRIPLPGDSPRTPIPPGNEPREFEELDIGAWDPAVGPTPGDVRIVLGRRERRVIVAECVPVQGTEHRLYAGRIEVERCLAGRGEPVREDFRRLAGGLRHVDPDCTGHGVVVDVFGWACRG